MHRISVTYEITVEKDLSIDMDEVIDAVVKDLDNDSEFSLFTLQCAFEDNIGYYLEKLNVINDSSVLSEYVQDEILEKFTNRMLERYPELDVL